MATQRGVYPGFIAGENITEAINANGIGKAVMYNVGTDQEVLVATAAGYQNFAGVIGSVDAAATITRTDEYAHQGARNVKEGDRLGIENDVMTDVLISGAVEYGDFLTTADGGKFQKLVVDATETATDVMKIVGRVVQGETTSDGGVVKAHIWVRK